MNLNMNILTYLWYKIIFFGKFIFFQPKKVIPEKLFQKMHNFRKFNNKALCK